MCDLMCSETTQSQELSTRVEQKYRACFIHGSVELEICTLVSRENQWSFCSVGIESCKVNHVKKTGSANKERRECPFNWVRSNRQFGSQTLWAIKTSSALLVYVGCINMYWLISRVVVWAPNFRFKTAIVVALVCVTLSQCFPSFFYDWTWLSKHYISTLVSYFLSNRPRQVHLKHVLSTNTTSKSTRSLVKVDEYSLIGPRLTVCLSRNLPTLQILSFWAWIGTKKALAPSMLLKRTSSAQIWRRSEQNGGRAKKII